MSPPNVISGLELARRFYADAVRPILDRGFPGLEHAAARIGWGSEVLGYDDETSRDHQWGPRLQLFLRDLRQSEEIRDRLAAELPTEFAGFPTHFGPTDEPGVVAMAAVDSGPVDHRVETVVLHDELIRWLGVDPLDGFTTADWLVTPGQRLLEWTAGEVFHDGIGELTRVRQLLKWYPHDVWLFVMAGHWQRVAEFEHLHGRAGLAGDDLGSRVVAAALVRDLMRLALLQHRRYPPYPKWLGTAHAALRCDEAPALERALRTDDWRSREDALVEVYEAVARRHNELGVTEHVEPTVRSFWGRAIRVLFADRFEDALRAAIADPALRSTGPLAGGIDAISDNTKLLTKPRLWRELRGLYDRA